MGMEDGLVAPYQVKLDNGDVIWAPEDTNEVIRPEGEESDDEDDDSEDDSLITYAKVSLVMETKEELKQEVAELKQEVAEMKQEIVEMKRMLEQAVAGRAPATGADVPPEMA